MSFNDCDIWVGDRDTLELRIKGCIEASIEIAETPRGFEYATHFWTAVRGAGYGIGHNPPLLTREEAVAAGARELAARLGEAAADHAKRGEPSAAANARKLLAWAQGLVPEQPSLFEECA